MKRILLMGNANVGKSVIFSRLTGVDVIASNYPGTTVEFMKGYMSLGGKKVEVIDVPGTYSLQSNSPAEEVAVNMLKSGDLIIDIIDATAFERNLNLTLQLLKSGKPVIIALNMWDDCRHRGIEIDSEHLEELLGVPVVPTCAITGEGIKKLVARISEARANTYFYEEQERWKKIGEISEAVQKITHRHHTFLETIGDLSVSPGGGILIAALVGFLSFWAVRLIGEGAITYIFEPIFDRFWGPLMQGFSGLLGGGGFLHDILVGRLIEGEVDFGESFGVLTTGLYVPLAQVLPYVFAFYLVLGLLEDSGYLPRLGILADSVMHRLGLHGLGVIPMFLGLGCNVPAAMATRVMETRKERFIAATLMAISVPCMAQIAMIAGLLGRYGVRGLGTLFGILFIVWFVMGLILRLVIKGETPEILVEIPPYRIPYWKAILKKLWIRLRQFVSEAVPFVLLGVVLVNFLYTLGVIGFIGRLAAPVISGLFGLPAEAVAALIVGFLRKDIAVGMLAPLGLSLRQLIVASVVLTIYFPCVATFTVLLRELGMKDMFKASAIMVLTALVVGGASNFLLSFVFP